MGSKLCCVSYCNIDLCDICNILSKSYRIDNKRFFRKQGCAKCRFDMVFIEFPLHRKMDLPLEVNRNLL